ncbi:hypothetical protein V6N13_025474 [Hibiscus sabdariffa]
MGIPSQFDYRFAKIPHPYFTRLKAKTMDMEANHQVLHDKFEKLEKDLKEEIAQAQRNTMGQIALMLGLPDPRRRKGIEESIPIGDSPYISEKIGSHDREQFRLGTSKTKVQFSTGVATNVPINSKAVYNHDPETEVPNFDEVEDKSKVEKKLEERCEKLEEMIRSMMGTNIHRGIEVRELSLVSGLEIPPKFKVPEFEKFDGTTCPSAHLTILVGSAARWYTQLNRTSIRTWRDLSRAFLEHYKHVTDMVLGKTALQSMEQKPNESFRQYTRDGER